MYRTELEVKTILDTALSSYAYKLFIGKSEQNQKSLKREVTFFILVSVETDVTALSSLLNRISLEQQNEMYLSGYEHGMLHGDVESYFFFVKANISSK